jgi:cytochrome c peroxidase
MKNASVAARPETAIIDAETLARLKTLELVAADPPPDVTNRFADEPLAAAFGQKLFFYPGFAGKLLDSDNDGTPGTLGQRGAVGRIACASCHVPEDGFVDTRSRGQQISLGAEWGVRRAPSLLNVAQRRIFTWIGKTDTFAGQFVDVLENEKEMNSSRLFVAAETRRAFRREYEALFGPLPNFEDKTRFPALRAEDAGCDRSVPGKLRTCRGRPGDLGAYDELQPEDKLAVDRVVANLGKALGAYLRQLRCGPGRFDAYLSGDRNALSETELRGAKLFVGKARCVECHSGPFLSDFEFHNVGLRPRPVAVAFVDVGDKGASEGLGTLQRSSFNSRGPYSDGDDGRLPTTIPDRMLGAFATPMLRCTSVNPSYMHTGQLRSLEAVVRFFNTGGDYAGYPGKSEISPLRLLEQEEADLVAFLRALDGTRPSAHLLRAPEATSP